MFAAVPKAKRARSVPPHNPGRCQTTVDFEELVAFMQIWYAGSRSVSIRGLGRPLDCVFQKGNPSNIRPTNTVMW